MALSSSLSPLVEEEEEDCEISSVLNLLNFKIVERQPGDDGYWNDTEFYPSPNVFCDCGAQLHKEEAARWRNKADYTEAQMSSAFRKLKEYEREIGDLKKIFDQQQFSSKLQKKQLLQNEETIAKLKNQSFLLTEENHKLCIQVEADVRKIASLEQALDRQANDLINSRERISELERDQISRNTFEPQLETDCLQMDVSNKQHYLLEAEKQNVELRNTLGEYEHQISDLTQKLELQRRELDDERVKWRLRQPKKTNHKKISELTVENRKLCNSLCTQNSKIGELQRANKKMQSELEGKVEYLKGTERIIEQQQQVLKNLKEKHKNEKENLLDARMSLELDVASRDDEIEKLKNELKRVTGERTNIPK